MIDIVERLRHFAKEMRMGYGVIAQDKLLDGAADEIERLRRPPASGRGDVIEECAQVADAAASTCDKLAMYYANAKNGQREQAQSSANAHRATAQAIRALKTAQPSPPGEVEQGVATRPDDGPTAPTDRL